MKAFTFLKANFFVGMSNSPYDDVSKFVLPLKKKQNFKLKDSG